MDSKKLALLCRELADNKRLRYRRARCAQAVVRDGLFVIASGTSSPHLRAIVEEIQSKLRDDHDLRPARTDGGGSASWVVLDYFDVIVHVMHAETRARYDPRGTVGRCQAGQPAQPRKKKTPTGK